MTLTFGISAQEKELHSTAEILSEVLKVKFVRHDSSFYGGDYYLAEVPEGEIYLQSNFDYLHDDDFEPEWPRDHLILYLAGEDDQSLDKAAESLKTTQQIGVVRLK